MIKYRAVKRDLSPFIRRVVFVRVAGIVVLLLQFGNTSSPSPIRNLYLATSGTDFGSCSDRAMPCLTFNYVDRRASSGTVVHVGPGIYNLTPGTCIVTNTSGVTWQSDIHGAATINGGGNCLYIWHNTGFSGNIRILGFQFTGVQVDSNANSVGVLLEGCEGGFDVAYNTFHDFGAGSRSDHFGAALSPAPFGCGTSNYTGRTCSVHDNVFYRIAPGSTFHFGGYSIYAICGNNGGSDPDPSIYNNVIYDEGSIGIHLWHAANHTHIYNNTIDNAYMGILVGVGDQGAVNDAIFDVTNNIISNSQYGIYAEDAAGFRLSSDTRFNDNLFFNNAFDWGYNHNGSTLDIRASFRNADNISGNPLYANPEGGNFRVRRVSPAVGKGLRNAYAPTLDLTGATRPNPPTIGAYEPLERP